MDIKVGDEVACLNGSFYCRYYSIEVIARETKTQFVLASGRRFYKKNLREVGDSYKRLEEVTQEIKDKIYFDKVIRKASILMSKLGYNENHIASSSVENIKSAISKMEEAIKLLKIEL